jgi:hypothetical protein
MRNLMALVALLLCSAGVDAAQIQATPEPKKYCGGDHDAPIYLYAKDDKQVFIKWPDKKGTQVSMTDDTEYYPAYLGYRDPNDLRAEFVWIVNNRVLRPCQFDLPAFFSKNDIPHEPSPK